MEDAPFPLLNDKPQDSWDSSREKLIEMTEEERAEWRNKHRKPTKKDLSDWGAAQLLELKARLEAAATEEQVLWGLKETGDPKAGDELFHRLRLVVEGHAKH